MPDARVVERLAITVVDFELAGAQNFECLFERLRTAALACTDSSTALREGPLRVGRLRSGASGRSRGRRGRCSWFRGRPRRRRRFGGGGRWVSPLPQMSMSLNSSTGPVRVLRGKAMEEFAFLLSSSLARSFSCGLTGTTATEANSDRT